MGLIEKLLKREIDIEKLEKNRDMERLLKLLKQELKSTKDLEVRVNAAIALRRIGDKRAIKPLNECLNDIKLMIAARPPPIYYSNLGDLAGFTQGAMLIAAKEDIAYAISVLERKYE